MFVKQMQVSSMAVFAYIVGDTITGDALVIDPADNVRGIIAEAGKNHLQINYIVNTHGHVDHISGNTDMKRATGAKIIIHEDDAVMLTNTPTMILKMFGAKPSAPADILVKEGDIISIGNIELRVIHTPGHSPGSICLYTPGYVFTGDTLFVEAVGRTDLPGGSWQELYQAVTEKLFTLPGDTIVLPGHNYGRMATSTIDHEKNTILFPIIQESTVMKNGMQKTDFKNLQLVGRGKVRDIYSIGNFLLIVTTDRISAFDVIMPNPIPGKGIILNRMSAFWFDQMKDIVGNHIVSTDPAEFPEECLPYRRELEGRSMLVKKALPLPIECIVRGYLSGSGWKDYQSSKTVSGIKLPDGLKESSKLPEPIFTPSTKAPEGEHDTPISKQDMADLIGKELTEKVITLSLAIYKRAAEFALRAGIIIADTKMEFGMIGNELFLIDELLTPDSSRFWPADEYQEGRPQKSFDKQFLRDYLVSINWNQKPPAPQLPPDIIENTRKKYEEALKRLVT